MARLTRREFLFLGAASGAAVAVGVVVPLSIYTRERVADDGSTATSLPLAVVAAFPKVRVASASSLVVGDPVMFDYPLRGQSSLLVKMGSESVGGTGPEGDIVAFSRICTHMGCAIEDYNSAHGVLGPCPCHFSTFDLAKNGQAALGQATQNLPRVVLAVEGDDIMATGLIRLVYGYANSLEGGAVVGEAQ